MDGRASGCGIEGVTGGGPTMMEHFSVLIVVVVTGNS